MADSIKVIVYLRPQHELAPSSYSTTVKSGNARPFRPPESDAEYFYNYDLMTRNWEAQVGRENVVVRIFSRDAFKDRSLIADMFDAMSLSVPSGLVIPDDKNTALAADALEFMRLANAILPRRQGGRINPDHIALVRLLTKMGPTPKFEIDRATAHAIESMFLDSNRAVAERYFPHMNGRLFPPARAAETVAQPLSSEALVRLAVEIWCAARLSRRPAAAARPPPKPDTPPRKRNA